MGRKQPGIGWIVRQKRLQLEFTQEELAERSGIDRTYISMLESEKASPTVRTLFRLATALRTKPSQLLIELEQLDELAR